jgi:hypothetical protein
LLGPDYARFRIYIPSENREPIDEIEEYWNARYLAAVEGGWRILGYHITKKDPAVTPLSVHLEGSPRNIQYFRRNTVPTNTNLQHYFCRPQGTFYLDGIRRSFSQLLYTEYFALFRLQKYDPTNNGRESFFLEESPPNHAAPMHVIQRQPDRPHITRIQAVHLSQGDVFYLRALLQNRPANSFLDIRTIAGVVYGTYQEAALALGLFATDNEAEYSMMEAVAALRTPRQMRILFIHLLTNECVPTPIRLWERFQEELSQDFILEYHGHVELGVSAALAELGQYLDEFGKTLDQYGLPQPISRSNEVTHELQRWSAQGVHLMTRAINSAILFNPEQDHIYSQITHAIDFELPLLLFIDGKAGRGKTFLVNVLCDWWRGTGNIVLATATSAFAAQLYPGGRTTHSTFKVNPNLHSTVQ